MPKLAGWLAVAILTAAPPALAQSPPPTGEWPVVGGNDAWQKYSPLDQIDRTNVSRLTRAWSWETGDAPIPGPRLPVPGQAVRPGDFQTTPIVVDGTMYLSTPYNRVAALDALTGAARWDYAPAPSSGASRRTAPGSCIEALRSGATVPIGASS